MQHQARQESPCPPTPLGLLHDRLALSRSLQPWAWRGADRYESGAAAGAVAVAADAGGCAEVAVVAAVVAEGPGLAPVIGSAAADEVPRQ
mmetsp:Transcript_68510/g.178005  ORF Transcript_68510/g.178005 Transcript_68510/m.178005 type:complete len:90 (+) Transcript_68510:222-491(+)